jgi:AraC-like DNA-binding protein
MPYRRHTLFRTPLLAWQRVELDGALPAWSPDYRVDGPRLLVPQDACFECSIGAARFVCDPTTALWLSPGQSYRMRRPHADQSSLVLAVGEDLAPSQRTALPGDAHLQLARWLSLLARGTAAEPLRLEEELACWVRSVVAAGTNAHAGHDARSVRAVERAREYLSVLPSRNDTLADIARAVHCSPFHLARTFRRRTGQSLHGYRTRLRMTQALHRLRGGERDLALLATDLGYASHSHFSGVFGRCFGTTPSRMRADLAAARR